MPGGKLLLELSENEALVLFDILTRLNEDDKFEKLLSDDVERKIFWDIESTLEAKLVEPGYPSYSSPFIIWPPALPVNNPYCACQASVGPVKMSHFR